MLVDTAQLQSRDDVTARVALPPDASKEVVLLLTVTEHLSVVGAVAEVWDEVQVVAAQLARTIPATAIVRRRKATKYDLACDSPAKQRCCRRDLASGRQREMFPFR